MVGASSVDSVVGSEMFVSLDLNAGDMASIHMDDRRRVRSVLFGSNDEIIGRLCAQVPSLVLELDFQLGGIVLRGSDADLAWVLPHIRALVENLYPDLSRRVAELQRDRALTEKIRRQYEGQFASRLENLPPAPVPQSLLELHRSHFHCTADFVEVLPGRCWVVPDVLTPQDCEDWICRAQTHGMEASKIDAARHNSRTRDFVDLDMAQLVWSRLPAELQREVELTSPNTDVRNVHEEWRISRYQPGQFFRAHYDESYTRGFGRSSHGGERLISNLQGEHGETSSHTLLLILSDGFSKGATRFWPTGEYDQAVDVTAPRGSMLVFEQLTLLHEGCVLEDGVKFVAQGALMRAPPSHVVPNANLRSYDKGFRFGNGMSSLGRPI